MMPEYLSFKLTGEIKNEYTNATTTNLVNAKTKQWDGYILDKLGLPKEIFRPLSLPGTSVGHFTEEVRNEVGFDCEVLLCPSHDTASAVAACPIEDDSVYISSGTWSLIGTENTEPILTEQALKANFTNEGGIEYRFRFLKNIMGMWLFQNIRKNLDKLEKTDTKEYVINSVRYVVSSKFSTTEEKTLKDKLSDFIGSDFAQLTKEEERNTMQEEYFCLTAGKEVSCSLK